MSDSRDKERPGCPFHAGGEPAAYGMSDLSYNDYLMVPELLSLQAPQSNPPHHDELLFIIIHQAYELWFKLILHEMSTAIGHLQDGQPLKAHHFVKRIVEIMRLLVNQIHILETMTPVDFLQFRDRLKPASGFQSMQFRELEFVAGLKDEKYLRFFENRPEVVATLKQRLSEPDLRSAYFEMLSKQGFKFTKGQTEKDRESRVKSLLPIYQKPGDNLPVYLLSESLVELDEYLGLWREHHVRVVERIIGFKVGTGGSSGVEYLRGTTSKKCFPELWDVRTLLV
jgi:tryptophan 2,3-dioxygenase